MIPVAVRSKCILSFFSTYAENTLKPQGSVLYTTMTYSISTPVRRIMDNPIQTRSDLVNLLFDLLVPLSQAQSSGGARICVGSSGTIFDNVAAELKGFARVLWGLAPLLSYDPEPAGFEHIKASWIKGLRNGPDPEQQSEYWGDCTDRDQRFVEMAAIGFSLCIAPDVFWKPLNPQERRNLTKWLLQANGKVFPDNNWKFFRVLINLGLKTVGAEFSQQSIDDELEAMEGFYDEYDLPADGNSRRSYDYYATSFGIPFYSLIYAHLCSKQDPERAARYKQRAIQNLPLVVHLFAPDGAPIPFGRSMTYRFAVCSFFSAVVYANIKLPQPFTMGVLKGLILRTIRYFCGKQEVFNRDGVLSIGYIGANLFMSEDYNSPQSPYWALKAFLILALPEDHPFWQAKEEPYPESLMEPVHTVVKSWGQVFTHAAGHTFCLSSGQVGNQAFRHDAAKYGKFAYSSAFGFSVPVGQWGLRQHAPDSMFSVTADDRQERWLVRLHSDSTALLDGGVLCSTWSATPEIGITVWLIPPSSVNSACHTRVYRIQNRGAKAVTYCDAGFAIHSQSGQAGSGRPLPTLERLSSGMYGRLEISRSALVRSRAGISGIISLVGEGQGRVQDTDANTNLIAARTVIPTIRGHLSQGVTWLASRVFALPSLDGQVGASGSDWEREWKDAQWEFGGLSDLRNTYGHIINF